MTRAANRYLPEEMGLALVVVEEHARRAVHLRDDDALGAGDDEGAGAGHQGHVAHVDVLLLDVADGARTGLFVGVPDDQAQRHFQRRGEVMPRCWHSLDIVFRLFELMSVRTGVPPSPRNHGSGTPNGTLPAGRRSADFRGHADLQKLVVGAFLHLDQVRHRRDFGDTPESPADSLAASKGFIHRIPSRQFAPDLERQVPCSP